MVKTELVEQDIRNGTLLLRELDAAGFQVTAALWFYNEDDEEWRYIIASPSVDRHGPEYAYSFVQNIIKTKLFDQLTLRRISMISPKNQLVKLLKNAIHIENGDSGLRFTRNTINGTFIEDAYIYRMR